MLDIRMFLDKLETTGDLRKISGAKLKFEVGVISEPVCKIVIERLRRPRESDEVLAKLVGDSPPVH